MRLTAQVLEIQEPRALAESLVGLLKRDDIRTDLGDDLRNSRRVEAPVGAHAFVDIIGGDHDVAAVHGGITVDDRGPSLSYRRQNARG